MWVLDTDMLTLWLRGHPAVVRQVQSRPPEDLAVTIITVEEVLGGWYSLIRQARDDDKLARAYLWLQQSVEFFRQIRIVSFTPSAIAASRTLRKEHRRIGANDLRIAAIVLEARATIVTRNEADFAAIPSLSIEDWSV